MRDEAAVASPTCVCPCPPLSLPVVTSSSPGVPCIGRTEKESGKGQTEKLPLCLGNLKLQQHPLDLNSAAPQLAEIHSQREELTSTSSKCNCVSIRILVFCNLYTTSNYCQCCWSWMDSCFASRKISFQQKPLTSAECCELQLSPLNFRALAMERINFQAPSSDVILCLAINEKSCNLFISIKAFLL